MKLVRIRSEVRKLSLHDKVQRPSEVKKLSEVPAALEAWDSHVREYTEAGGRSLAYEDRKLALINILPSEFRPEMLMRLQMLPDPPSGAPQAMQDEYYIRLRSSLQKQIELINQLQTMGSLRGGGPGLLLKRNFFL